MKISTQAKLISTALVAAAIAAPIAHGQSDGMLIYQASQKAAASSPSGYVPLKTGEGFSFKAPSYWSSAHRTAAPAAPGNAMNRSLGVPPRYQLHDTKPVDPFAVSYLMGRGLSPSEVRSWTVGACSHQVKAASCYAMLETSTPSVHSVATLRSGGFDWGDAGIGAGAVLGILLLAAGMGAGLVTSRQNRRREVAGA